MKAAEIRQKLAKINVNLQKVYPGDLLAQVPILDLGPCSGTRVPVNCVI